MYNFVKLNCNLFSGLPCRALLLWSCHSKAGSNLSIVRFHDHVARELARFWSRTTVSHKCLSGTIIMLCYILLRMKSLETAVELLESADIQVGLISDQIKQISQKSLNITNFAIADPKNLHEQLKVHLSFKFIFILADTCRFKSFSQSANRATDTKYLFFF